MNAPDAPAWHVQLLGRVRLAAADGREITRLPSRAITLLLARLALAPTRDHAREELVELLWPGVELDVGRNRLRQALSSLKSLLEPADRRPPRTVLLADRVHVRVAPGALACDAVDFEAALRAGRAAEALALYGGELLPGHYDDWVADERLRLEALHDRARDRAPEAAPMPAEPPPAARAPGVPSGTAPPRAVRLPVYLTATFGAEGPARRLREQVLAHRLVTLVGPGGSGKTRMAIEVAHSLHGQAGWPLPVEEPSPPFELIAFVSLVDCRTRAALLDAIAGALQLPAGGADPLAALAEALSARRACLVLDNFEQLVDAAADVAATLVARAPALHLLVTSRRALAVDGEREFAHATLPLPAEGAGLAEAAANPAVALFVDRARAVRADFHLGARNAGVLAALVRELEGMPLALELAAARVRSVAPADMLARLRSGGTPRLDLLARGSARGAADPRHASMQRTLAWSWELLAPAQAALLAAVTQFAGPFDGDDAATLAAGLDDDVPLRLDELVAQSLVQATGQGDGLVFSVYQPVREFAQAQLPAPEAARWRARLRHWALACLQALPATPPLARLRAALPNLAAAFASAAADGAGDDAVHLLLAARRAFEDLGLPAASLAHAREAVRACHDPALQAIGHALVAPLLFNAGQADAALAHAELGVRRDLLHGRDLARALHALARVRWRSRRVAAEVEPLLDEAEVLLAGAGAAEDDLRASIAALRAFVANVHHRDPARAIALHSQALTHWEGAGNRLAALGGRYNLATVAVAAGWPAQAVAQLDPVIAEARALGDTRRLGHALNTRANALSSLHRWPEALADYQAGLRVAWDAMAPYETALLLWNLPRALLRLGHAGAAMQLGAHAGRLWEERFAELSAAERQELRRLRRLGERLLGRDAAAAAWRAGEALAPGDAVALALSLAPPA